MCKCGNKTSLAAIGSRGVGVGGARGGAGAPVRDIHDIIPQRIQPQPRFHGLVVTSPCVWGPPMWKILHTIAEFTNTPGVPPISREWLILINAMPTCLPCPDCARHFEKWVTSNPLAAPISRDDIRLWWLNLHNRLNEADGVAVYAPEMLTELYGGDKYVKLAAIRPLVSNLRGVIGTLVVDCMLVMIQKMLAR